MGKKGILFLTLTAVVTIAAILYKKSVKRPAAVAADGVEDETFDSTDEL
jgi:hypothetical protein